MNKQNRDIILIKLDTQFIQAVEKTVGEIEQHTDSEVVVVAHARVDPWSVLSLRAALTVVALVLCFVVWSPWTFHVQWLPLELLVIGLLVGWWAKTSPRLLRLFVGKARIRERVEEAASADSGSDTSALDIGRWSEASARLEALWESPSLVGLHLRAGGAGVAYRTGLQSRLDPYGVTLDFDLSVRAGLAAELAYPYPYALTLDLTQHAECGMRLPQTRVV